MTMLPRWLTAAGAIFALCGCTSFNLSQTNRFINEDGEVISVDYGSGDSDYVTTFKSPMNGVEHDFKSKLRVRVTMPDGARFMAFQCFNELRSGTLYRSGNEKWSFHANGFTCTVYRLNERNQYEPVFNGVVCQSPQKPGKEQRR